MFEEDDDTAEESLALPASMASTAAKGGSTPTGNSSDESNMASTIPRKALVLQRRQALDWVEKTLIQTRGRELVGNFNPLLIGELFWEQSQNWEGIAQKHIEVISRLCTNFVSDLLQELCSQDIYARLIQSDVEKMLKQRLHCGQVELKKIIATKKLYPSTYNHYYTTTIQRLRSQRADKKLEDCIAESRSQST